jgi:hypothetical protein
MNEFLKWVDIFLKNPILPEQEAKIICAMIDGSLNKEGAKRVFHQVVQQNIELLNKYIRNQEDKI